MMAISAATVISAPAAAKARLRAQTIGRLCLFFGACPFRLGQLARGGQFTLLPISFGDLLAIPFRHARVEIGTLVLCQSN